MVRERGRLDDRAGRAMTGAPGAVRLRHLARLIARAACPEPHTRGARDRLLRLPLHPSVFRRPWGALGAGRWIAPAIALALVVAGCTALRGEPVPGAPAGTTIVKLTGFRPASTPPDPRTASPSAIELEGSLRRIVVSYIKFTVWFRTDPRPLLSERQISAYAQILARELPTLRDTQRLRFTFTDRYLGRGYIVEFDVYREGTFLVYWFNDLAYNPTTTSMNAGGVGMNFLAVLEPSPGREVENREKYAYLKDPLLGEERALEAEGQEKRQLFEQARSAGDFEPDETERLTALLARPQPNAAAWRSYWERRHTLKTALEQRLLDRAAYSAQVERLNAEMERADRVSGEERALEADQKEKRQQLEQARNTGDFEPDEEQLLKALLARPEPNAAAWKSYWERRHTLKAALEQKAIDRAAYHAQVERLNAEMEKPEK